MFKFCISYYCLEKTKCDPNENSGQRQQNADSLAIEDEDNKTEESQRNTNTKINKLHSIN